MLPKLTSHLSSFFWKSQTRLFSTLSPDQIKLKYLYSKANSDLLSPNSVPLAIKTFKTLTVHANEMFQDNSLRRSFWHSLTALKLAERNLHKESEEFLQEGIKLLNQNKLQTSQSQEYCEICFYIGQTFLFRGKPNLSEEFFIKCYNSIESVSVEWKMLLFEKLIPVELILKNYKEVIKFSEEALQYFESRNDKRAETIRILACYGKSLLNLKHFEKAILITKKVIPLICMEEKNTEVNRFIIDSYYLLIDSYVGLQNNDEAIEAVLTGGKVIEKWFGGLSALEFYENTLKFTNFGISIEPILNANIELAEKTLNDNSKKIKVYKDALEFFIDVENHEKSIEYSNKCLEIAKKLNDPSEITESYMKLALVYLKIDPETAKSYIELAKMMVKNSQNKDHRGELEYVQYHYFNLLQDYESADESLEKYSLYTPDIKENGQILFDLYLERSNLNFNLKKNDKSLIMINKAQEISDKYFPQITENRSKILSKKGILYVESAEYEKGLECFINVLNIEEALKKHDFIPTIIAKNNIMNCYLKMNQVQIAFETGEKFLEVIRDRQDLENKFFGLFLLRFGEVCLRLNFKEKAKSCYLKALRIFKSQEIDSFVEIAEKSLKECEEI